jgi:large subunit ribosomal protein L24
VKKNDVVVVLAGRDKGKRGRVISVLGKKQRVIVEGVCMIKRHMRKSQTYPQGKIVEREGTLHLSNVMKAETYDARASRRAASAASRNAGATP